VGSYLPDSQAVGSVLKMHVSSLIKDLSTFAQEAARSNWIIFWVSRTTFPPPSGDGFSKVLDNVSFEFHDTRRTEKGTKTKVRGKL
jgi:hypothetical protein